MATNGRRLIIRSVCVTLVVHTLFVVVTVPTAYFLWWELRSLSGRQLDKHVLRVIELPVLWIVEDGLQTLPLIPPWATFGGGPGFAIVVNEVLLFSVFGGAFYSLVAAILTLIHLWKASNRNKRSPQPE